MKHGMPVALVPVMFLFLIIAVVVSIGPNIFGSLENDYDYANDSYQTDYDGMTELVHVDTMVLVVAGITALGGLMIIVLLKFT